MFGGGEEEGLHCVLTGANLFPGIKRIRSLPGIHQTRQHSCVFTDLKVFYIFPSSTFKLNSNAKQLNNNNKTNKTKNPFLSLIGPNILKMERKHFR